MQLAVSAEPYLSGLGKQMSYYVIFNAKSGAALSLGLTGERLGELLKDIEDIEVDAGGDDLQTKIERALKGPAEIVVCAGGDGTATAIAQRLAGSGKTLAILPLGTANLLARDLGLPLALEAAISSLKDLQATDIDAGEVNGRLFLHKVVVGVIPAIAAAREKVRGGGFWALLRFASYFVQRLNNARKTAIAITSRDTQNRIERVHAIAVANNAYDQGWGKVFRRSCLNAGCLTLYVLRHLSAGDAIRLAFEMATGRWKEDDAVTIETVRSVTLRGKRQKVSAMIDGEVEVLETPLEFRIRPKALRVLAPTVAATDPGGIAGEADADRPSLRLALWPS